MAKENNFFKLIEIVLLTLYVLLITLNYSHQNPIYLPNTGLHKKTEISVNYLGLYRSSSITKVSVPGLFSYPVVQSGDNAPNQAGVVGQYSRAKDNGNIGLIAHNYLAGSIFSWISKGNEVQVTKSNGEVEYYVVSNILRFQASDPNNFSKPFINQNGQSVSAEDVFDMAYRSGIVTFQTCIAKNGISSWGIYMIQAVPGRGNVYTAPIQHEAIQVNNNFQKPSPNINNRLQKQYL